jgi:hypothetical protein
MFFRIIAVCGVVALIAGCGGASQTESESGNSPAGKQLEPGYVSAEIFRAEEKDWPLTVPEAVIGCDKGMLLWLEIDGTKYGLNGSAKGFGYPDFRSYWRFDETYLQPGEEPVDGSTPRVNIQPLFDRAEQLC